MTTLPTSIVKLATVNPDFLKRILLLGAVTGSGTGLVQSLLKQRNAILADEDDDDAPLPADMDPVKAASGALDNLMNVGAWAADKGNRALGMFASKSDPATQPNMPDSKLSLLDYTLAGTGGPLAFLLGLTATRGLYNRFEKSELKKQMRDEQEALLQAIDQEAKQKLANADPAGGRAPGKMDMSLLTLLGVLGLTGVTAGVLTDQALTSQFPAARAKSRPVRVLTPANAKVDGADAEEDAEAFGKIASELLVHVALSLEGAAGDVTDAVKAAAAGLMPDVSNALLEEGVSAAFDMCSKAASVDISNPLVKFAAVRAALRSPFGGVLNKVAASVFADRCPAARTNGTKINQHPEFADQFTKLAGLLVTTMLWASDVGDAEKSASAAAPTLAEQENADDLLEGRPIKDVMTSGDASSLVNAQATTSHGESDSKRNESDLRPSLDPIDQVLTGA